MSRKQQGTIKPTSGRYASPPPARAGLIPLFSVIALYSASSLKTTEIPSRACCCSGGCEGGLEPDKVKGKSPSIFDDLSSAVSSLTIGNNESVVVASDASPEQK